MQVSLLLNILAMFLLCWWDSWEWTIYYRLNRTPLFCLSLVWSVFFKREKMLRRMNCLLKLLNYFILNSLNPFYKFHSLLTANPDVTVNEMTDDVEFMLLACDGIWDVMTNQEVVNFIRARIVHGMEPESVSIFLYNILHHILSLQGCCIWLGFSTEIEIVQREKW